MDCIFCKINEGTIPSKTIFEDEIVKVMMDINPKTNGHLLVIPKKHYTDFLEVDDLTLTHMYDVAKKMKENLYNHLKPDGLILTINYGITQEIKHLHLHIVPIYEKLQEIQNLDAIYEKITL